MSPFRPADRPPLRRLEGAPRADNGPPGASSPGPADMSAALELELRQLAGVVCVSFGERGGALLVELVVENGSSPEWCRSEARRVTLSHLDGPVVIEVVVDDPPIIGLSADRRVRVVVTEPQPGRAAVEVHLAYRDRWVTMEASIGDRLPVAVGVIDGLRRLGFGVAYEVVQAAGMPEPVGSGTLVVLLDPVAGTRHRGVATGRDDAEATARAVLNALNRVMSKSSPEGLRP